MRILIDCRVLDRKITGTGRFLLNILNELPNQDQNNEYYLLSETDIHKKLSLNSDFFRRIRIHPSFLPAKVYSAIALNFIIPNIIRKNDIDIFFQPNILIPLFRRGKTKYISVIHDIIPVLYKEYYPLSYRIYLKFFLCSTVKNADKIITVSKTSKDDIIKYFRICPEKLEIAYNVADSSFFPLNLTEEKTKEYKDKFSLPDKYLLYVGVIEKRKNIDAILSTIDIVRTKGSKIQLLIVGRSGYGFKKIYPEIIKRKQYVKYISYIDDRSLKIIYNLAFAFMFPSNYEGFGIPPLEAMQCGIPVLASNNSSLGEVVGDGGLLHSPEDSSGFANDILRLESDNEYYNLIKEKSLLRAKRFNIAKTTKNIVSAINQFALSGKA